MAKTKKTAEKAPKAEKPVEVVETNEETQLPQAEIEAIEKKYSEKQPETKKLPTEERIIPKAEKGKNWVTDYTELVEVEGTAVDQRGKLYYGVKKPS